MPSTTTKSVLITGADGCIGNAVARAFVRAGWKTYGLVRNVQTMSSLAADEIIPVLGSPADLAFLEKLYPYTQTLDVVVSATEQIFDYLPDCEDAITLLRTLSKTSNDAGGRPLILFTSDCKDYGSTGHHGSPDLSPHTESSPLQPPTFVSDPAKYAIKILEHSDLFDAVVLRPTPIYGLDVAAKAAREGILELPADPRSIMHGAHVDDCAETYVAIAEHPHVVKGQCYNVSGHRYETLCELANALVKEYDNRDGVKFVSAEGSKMPMLVQMVIGSSQWVGSEKLRTDVGWKDKRVLFSEGLHAYGVAYEAAVEQKHGNVESILRKAEAMQRS